jgi:hypothetical protein
MNQKFLKYIIDCGNRSIKYLETENGIKDSKLYGRYKNGESKESLAKELNVTKYFINNFLSSHKLRLDHIKRLRFLQEKHPELL